MGTAETEKQQLIIRSHIVTYGNAATDALTREMADEIETMWNEPGTWINLQDYLVEVVFRVTAECKPGISDLEIYENLDPVNNYFRIEEYANGNISFVDGLGCNSGYFKLENLYTGSTTAAHEYGHTLGLDHPSSLDIRGKGVPGIMYPRGTLVDSVYQYEPEVPAGQKGGTLHPKYRKVRDEDILLLKLDRLNWQNGKAIIGEFTNIWHPSHGDLGEEAAMA